MYFVSTFKLTSNKVNSLNLYIHSKQSLLSCTLNIEISTDPQQQNNNNDNHNSSDDEYIAYMKVNDTREVTFSTNFRIKPIGIVRSPYQHRLNTPKQATIEKNGGKQPGRIDIFSPFLECLDSLEGFDYIWAITYMHLNSGYKTKIKPMPNPVFQQQPNASECPDSVGLFCSRAPHRPNPIALSALKIVSINHQNGTIFVDGLDLLNGKMIISRLLFFKS